MSDANRARGFKSTLSNPNTSQEAKQHAREELNRLGEDASYGQSQTRHGGNATHHTTSGNQYGEKNEGNVVGGYKAALRNPNVSQEAKDHAQDVLDDLDDDGISGGGTSSRYREKNEGNVIGGYKATLKNPNVSEEAKEHAQEVLEEHGVQVD